MPEDPNSEAEQIRAVMSLIGKRKTAKKSAASAANAAKASASTRKEEAEILCTCGRPGPANTHAWSCRRRRWANTRKRREEARKKG